MDIRCINLFSRDGAVGDLRGFWRAAVAFVRGINPGVLLMKVTVVCRRLCGFSACYPVMRVNGAMVTIFIQCTF